MTIKIQNKACSSCGSPNAMQLTECPYCNAQQPTYVKLSEDTRKKINEFLKKLKSDLWEGPFLFLFSFIFFLWIPIIPGLLALAVYFITLSIPLTIIFSLVSVAITIIIYLEFKDWRNGSDHIERFKWKMKYRKKMKKFLKEMNLPPDIYFELIIDFLQNEENPGFTGLAITIHEK